MLDKLEEKDVVEAEEPADAAVSTDITVQEVKEESKAEESVKEESRAGEPAKEEAVKEEPKKTGYLSEIDGVEVDFELQYREHETDMKDIAKRVTEDYARRGNDASGIELIQVYLKPTDFTAYYVINNSYEGKIPLF